MSQDGTDGPTDDEVVRAAADAAEDLVFSRIDRRDVADLDVTVTYEDYQLDVDVYLHAPDVPADAQQVAEDATLAARAAADKLLE